MNTRFYYLVSSRKHQFLRYARHKNAHLRKVNSAFSDFASLELGVFLTDTVFSCKHFLLIIFLLINTYNFAQEASKIKPVKIVWVADGDTIDIDQAQRGIDMPNNIEIAVVFDSRTIGKLDGQKLEFKWFRKGATRNYLTNSFYQEFNSTNKGSKAYTLSTGRGELKKGWWKVQIEAYADRNLLSYRNKQEFWINLK